MNTPDKPTPNEEGHGLRQLEWQKMQVQAETLSQRLGIDDVGDFLANGPDIPIGNGVTSREVGEWVWTQDNPQPELVWAIARQALEKRLSERMPREQRVRATALGMVLDREIERVSDQN